MSLLRCPICCAPLQRAQRSYRCPDGHSYDIAKEGYVHLLPANQMHSKTPGDDKAMVAARNRFLSAGYYAPLRHALQTLALQYTQGDVSLVDSGCGEGYYTAGVVHSLAQEGHSVQAAGVDISKFALRWAARRDSTIEFAVGSAYRLPVADHCADLLLNCFSPLAVEEFTRVLKPEGVFFYVVPAADHLWELKEVLYDTPYPNPEQDIIYDGFTLVERREVAAPMHLSSQEHLMDLFSMTPYFWKTPSAGVARLQALNALDVRAGFRIYVFRAQ